jgi:hypothetical protein
VILRASRLKIGRANKHISEANAHIAILSDPETYAITDEYNRNANTTRITYHTPTDMEERIDNIALATGDAIHNLRTSLDYAWFETLKKRHPTAIDHDSKLPTGGSFDDVKSLLRKRKIEPTFPLYNFILSEVCPYDGGNDTIRQVHKIDRSDKHTLLTPIIRYGAATGIKVEDKAGNISSGFTWGASQPRSFSVDFEGELKIHDKGEVAAAILFGEGTTIEGMEVSDTLRLYSKFILNAEELFEGFLDRP